MYTCSKGKIEIRRMPKLCVPLTISQDRCPSLIVALSHRQIVYKNSIVPMQYVQDQFPMTTLPSDSF